MRDLEEFLFPFLKNIYLFTYFHCRIFSCSMGTLSCRMWDLVPWSGIEPEPSAVGARTFKWEISEWTLFSGEPVKNPEYSSLHPFEHTTGVKHKSRLSFWQQTNRAFGILSTSYRSFTCSKSKAVKFEIRIIAYKLLISFGEQLHL